VRPDRILARAADLRSVGTSFVLATVVWRQGPSSSKEGGRAIIHADGSVEGWIGGACAEPTLVREALSALTDGRSRLLSMGVGGDAGDRPGVVSVAMACESEGAMEVFVEPQFPSPQLVVIGRSPAVHTLLGMAEVLGWRTALVDDGGTPEKTTADVVIDRLDLSQLTIDSETFVVVATQGHYDEVALEAVLATEAGYVGLVTSGERARSVMDWLVGRGMSKEAMDRIDAPAGLDLGPIEHEEIAVAVLADLVRRRAEGVVRPVVVAERPDASADPVCGMTVEPSGAKFSLEVDGRRHFFCSAGCQVAFEADPGAFVSGDEDPEEV